MATRNVPELWRSGGGFLSPLREMNRMQRRMDRIFDDLLSSFPMAMRPTRDITEMEEEIFSPPCDVDETGTHYLMSFDLPGIRKEDLKIEVRDNQLMVSGMRKHEMKEEQANRLSMERFTGSFMRSFTLPSSVDPNRIEANYENGVLHVAIPKTEAMKGRTIQIKEERGGFFSKLLGHEEKEVKAEKTEKPQKPEKAA